MPNTEDITDLRNYLTTDAFKKYNSFPKFPHSEDLENIFFDPFSEVESIRKIKDCNLDCQVALRKYNEINRVLTEDNIGEYGFEKMEKNYEGYMFHHYINKEKIGLSLCKKGDENFIENVWYYGTDFISIRYVYELQYLYELLTKRKLIKIK